jgi:hypothetical protein
VDIAKLMVGGLMSEQDLVRGGREAHQLDARMQI